MTAPRLSILIPTFNEERTIERLIRRILTVRFPLDYELIIVDDHSTDRTVAIEQRLRREIGSRRLTLIRNRVNKGKGACIRQAVKHATGELIIVQDGDLEYKPRDIPRLLHPLMTGEAVVVYGSRFHSRWRPSGMAWPNCVANRLLTALANVLYGLRLTDMETCYKVIRLDLLKRLRLRTNRFEFEPEVTAKLASRRIPITEVPISYHGRTVHEGKKIRAKDFFLAIWTLIRYRW